MDRADSSKRLEASLLWVYIGRERRSSRSRGEKVENRVPNESTHEEGQENKGSFLVSGKRDGKKLEVRMTITGNLYSIVCFIVLR